MKKVFFIPSAITAFGLSIGLFVIYKTSLADPNRDLFSTLQAAAILLLVAGVADLADGAVARLIKAESEFGGQFDSLSDAVTFGVAPPLLMIKSLTQQPMGRLLTFFIILAAMIYALCGVLRLVRYNIKSKETRESGDKARIQREQKHFTGLPIPAAATAAVSASLILISPYRQTLFSLSLQAHAWLMIGVLITLGYFMVSRWKFPSIKALHFRIPTPYLIFATGILAVILLYGIVDYFAEAMFIVSWLYLLVAWTLSLVRIVAGKRSKTLVDFEPDQED